MTESIERKKKILSRLENEEGRLDRRIAEQRKAIESKEQTASTLDTVLARDYERIKNKIPRWFILLTVTHFFMFLLAFKVTNGPKFLANVIMFFWCQRRFYREISGWAVPLSVLVLFMSFSFGSSVSVDIPEVVGVEQ